MSQITVLRYGVALVNECGLKTVVYNVLINKSECVHYDDVVVNEII